MDTIAFLRHILSEDGWICIDLKNKGRGFRHNFFKDFARAAAFILEQDALGEIVYHACATFKTDHDRKQVNVAYLKSFWGDCDVGPDKPYKTRQEAEDALIAFLRATGLPPPTIVYSGPYGFHLYWVLEKALTPDDWRPRAEAFRALCKQHGFHLDHSRTADHSSVLRPPGTHNRKRGSLDPVTVAYVSTPLAVVPFEPVQKAHPHQHAVRHGGLLEGASAYSDRPSDAHKIIAGCAQIRQLRDRKGNIPYDPWLHSIWTLHFTTQGDELAHELSSGHLKYTYEETQRKLDEASSPIRCSTFDRHNDLCKSCEYWSKISTPLEIGRMSLPAVPVPLTPLQQMNGVQVAESFFINDERGLRYRTENKKSQPVEQLISRAPISLSTICRQERNLDFSLIFNMTTPHMGEVPIAIDTGTFFSAMGMSEMARMGAVIHETDMFRKYVREQMDQFHINNAPQTRYSQFGWKDHDNAFLIGNRLYTQSQVLTAAGTPEIERRARMLGPRSGNLSAWSAAANKLFAAGCEPHSYALMCAFGAVLMRFLSEEEGGAILNLVSEGSATGKTTGLEAVASVWGELDGLRLLDEDTAISRGVFLGTLGNLPCVFDELHKRDPDSIRAFVTMFTNGRDKLRARADGTLRDPSGDWQTILVLGSNVSLTDILQSKNSEEAQAFRILELIAEQNFTGNEGDKLRRQLKENAGWAGDAFVKHLMHPGMLQAVRAGLDEAVAALWHPWYGFDKRHRFWVRQLACAQVAGHLACHLGLLDFNPARIIKWVIERCKERKDTEIKRDNVQLLNEALYEIWASTLVVDTAFKPHGACLVLSSPGQNRQFLARRERDNGRMYVQRTWLRSWMVKHGINRTSFTADLKKRLVIIDDHKFITLGAGTEHSSGGQIICFEIDMHHPEMAGMLEMVERDVPKEEKARKPIDTLRVPGAGSPSLPPTLQ